MAVETPRHSAVGGLLDYTSEQPLAPGTPIRVPLGRREVPGVVWDLAPSSAATGTELREVASVLDAMPVLDADWRALVDFAAAYYQRSVGELCIVALDHAAAKWEREVNGTGNADNVQCKVSFMPLMLADI